MEIKSVSIKNYRSFNDLGIDVDSPNRINIFIGKNNSGKSNIIKFLALFNGPFLQSINSISYNQEVSANLGITLDDHFSFDRKNNIEFTIKKNVNAEIKEKLINIDIEEIYITYTLINRGGSYVLKIKETSIDSLDEQKIRNFETEFVNRYGGSQGGMIDQAKKRVNSILNLSQYIKFEKVEYLEEFRKLSGSKELREKLWEIINPEYINFKEAKKKRELLYEYFKLVFNYEIEITIPHIDSEINLIIESEQKPLSSLGSGLQQIILIAFKILTTNANIICIDEPELYLHPGAQRALLNLISKIDDKQFFLSTHSNNFLDYEINDKNFYLISKEGNHSKIEKINNQKGINNIIDDLGIRASEIYQTNGIIWVEGPSDRVFIKRWLELKYPEIKEGLQFTFQFYGGKILSHYSIEDQCFKDYLNLLTVNKNCLIVMDSDMDHDYNLSDLRETKKRIITECDSSSIFYWVSKGKEIENYINDRLLKIYDASSQERNIYKAINEYLPSFNSKTKVEFARKISKNFGTNDINNNYDLLEKIEKIAEKIKEWNI